MGTEGLNNIIWINKIVKGTTEVVIRELFSEYGEIKSVLLCESRNRQSLFSFIEFDQSSSAQKALEKNDFKQSDGTPLVVAFVNAKQYISNIKKMENKNKIKSEVVQAIQNMSVEEAYYYGFKEGKKYVLQRQEKDNKRRGKGQQMQGQGQGQRANARTRVRANAKEAKE
jgi:RNA recognition motif-containing protein